jgi:hypothetical protein
MRECGIERAALHRVSERGPIGAAFGVTRGRRLAEGDNGFVPLLVLTEELRKARRAAQQQHEDAGRHRVERTGMSDARLPKAPASDGDDVVRRQARRLVDDEAAFRRAGSGLSSAHAGGDVSASATRPEARTGAMASRTAARAAA